MIFDAFGDGIDALLSKVQYQNSNVCHGLSLQIETWTQLKSRLAPDGRLMANIKPEHYAVMTDAFEGVTVALAHGSRLQGTFSITSTRVGISLDCLVPFLMSRHHQS